MEMIRARFEARCARENLEREKVLLDTFGPDFDQEAFWEKVKTNLQAGKVRMLFVADLIPAELRRVVEFLNAQMDPAEVLALEVRQFVGGDLKTLVPRVIGQTAEAQQKKRVSTGETAAICLPGASEFLQSIEQAPESEQARLRRLAEWAQGLEQAVLPGCTPQSVRPGGCSIHTCSMKTSCWLRSGTRRMLRPALGRGVGHRAPRAQEREGHRGRQCTCTPRARPNHLRPERRVPCGLAERLHGGSWASRFWR